MKTAVLESCKNADALLMAAAVADFRPAKPAGQKLKRSQGVPEVKLEPTDDILAAVAEVRKATGRPSVVVGFAAESQDLVAHAREKLKARDLSLIVANDITAADAGFGVDTNRVTLLDATGAVDSLPLMSKEQVGEVVMDRVVTQLG
jgi:phosphopantothenoylcysteine decarboxylase/phosphopantothenate--cysteine ligase